MGWWREVALGGVDASGARLLALLLVVVREEVVPDVDVVEVLRGGAAKAAGSAQLAREGGGNEHATGVRTKVRSGDGAAHPHVADGPGEARDLIARHVEPVEAREVPDGLGQRRELVRRDIKLHLRAKPRALASAGWRGSSRRGATCQRFLWWDNRGVGGCSGGCAPCWRGLPRRSPRRQGARCRSSPRTACSSSRCRKKEKRRGCSEKTTDSNRVPALKKQREDRAPGEKDRCVRGMLRRQA